MVADQHVTLGSARPVHSMSTHMHPRGPPPPGRIPPLCEVGSQDGEGDAAHFECNCVDMICPASAESICCVIKAALAGSMPAWPPLSIPDGGITAPCRV